MSERVETANKDGSSQSFFERPGIELGQVPVGPGVPFGIEQVSNSELGIGGAYGTWGESYDNDALLGFIERRHGAPPNDQERLDLSPLGFVSRHHIVELSPQEHLELEVAMGARFVRDAAHASGWEPEEVEGLLMGTTAPVSDDFTERVAQAAGIPDSALMVSIHKACDSSVGGLHLALNPDLPANRRAGRNIAQSLHGKKILVGGFEGLSRFVNRAPDKFALQLFGNGAGFIGLIPGQSMKFLVGKSHEVFDQEGYLAVSMYYPHSGAKTDNQSNVMVSRSAENRLRFAGLMNEPADGSPVVMAGPMGMVKLFVRTGVQVVRDVYLQYRAWLDGSHISENEIKVAVAHHANLKINSLKAKHLQKQGIHISMPWVLSEFGNVSAASNMIAFLRQLPSLNSGDHVLIDGFGAGTYYDTLAVELGESRV